MWPYFETGPLQTLLVKMRPYWHGAGLYSTMTDVPVGKQTREDRRTARASCQGSKHRSSGRPGSRPTTAEGRGCGPAPGLTQLRRESQEEFPWF